MIIEETAQAKINLSLRILGRRPDGYHDLETIMLKLNVADEIRLDVSEGDGISVEVPQRPDLNGPDNLAAKAAKGFCDALGLRRNIHILIDKQIPVGGGLGGGSADAAAVLRGLAREFKGMGEERLYALATELGADVSFLLHPAPMALAEGIGERLTPLEVLPSRPLVLLNPGFSVSTSEAYSSFDRRLTSEGSDGNSFAALQRPKNWSDLDRLINTGRGNDFQPVVEKNYPEIAKARQRLLEEGAISAQMSGSGATVFGFFEDQATAKTVCQNVSDVGISIFTTTVG
jgi:4-diphosphocytidyl-2-C-methyl-D-erythritol kinase